MMRLREMKEKYKVDDVFRKKVFNFSILLTIINWVVCFAFMWLTETFDEGGQTLGMLPLGISIAATVGLFYITDGLLAIIYISQAIAKFAAGLVGALASCVAFFMGIGVIFGYLMGIVAFGVCFLYIGILCYIVPVLSVPLFSWINTKLMGTESQKHTEKKKQENIFKRMPK